MTDLDADDWDFPTGLRARLVTEADRRDEMLTEAERNRLRAFGSAARQRQFSLGRVAARTLAAERLGGDPSAVPLRVAEDGAPEVPGLALSIAHTGRGGGVAALAAVGDRALGVDLERVGPRRPDLWRRILDPSEYAVLDALGGPTDETQTLLWTLKEAVLKAQRTGFRAGGRSVVLSLDGEGHALKHGTASAQSGAGTWSVSYGRVDDLWLAVAYEKQTR